MSQASNKVKWCVSKAEKELAETGMHRGIVAKDQDIVLANLLIAKATHNLSAALFFEKNGYSDWSASAFFYSIYHCFLAILRKFGYESRNQECTVAVIEMLQEQGKIKIDSKLINSLKIMPTDEQTIIKIREDFQYGTSTDFHKKEQFDNLSRMCKDAIETAKQIVFS